MTSFNFLKASHRSNQRSNHLISSKPFVGPFPRVEISFYLLPTWIDELFSISKIITFLPNPLLLDNEKK